MQAREFPSVIWIMPSAVCNLRCPGCIHGQIVDKSAFFRTKIKFMSLNGFKAIVGQVKDFKPLLSLTGVGETFLNPHIYEMLEYAVLENELQVQMDSNGHNMDVARLASCAPFSINFALDGFSQESYQTYRVGGRFDEVLGNMKALAEACAGLPPERKPTITWKYCVHKFNEHELEAAKEFCAREMPDVKFRTGSFHIPPPDYLWRQRHGFAARPEDFEHWSPNEKVRIYYLDEKEGNYLHKSYLMPFDGCCEMIWNEAWVTVDGRVYPCCRGVTSVYGDNFVFGNAYEEGVVAAFHSAKAEAFRKNYLETKGDWSECSTCIFSRVRSIMQAVDLDPEEHKAYSSYRKLEMPEDAEA